MSLHCCCWLIGADLVALISQSRMETQVRKGIPQGLTPKPKALQPSVPSAPKVKAPSPKLFAFKAKEAVKPAQQVNAYKWLLAYNAFCLHVLTA